MIEVVIPSLGRTLVTETGDALSITVPPRRRPWAILGGVVYLGIAGWILLRIWRTIAPGFGEPPAGVGDILLYGFLILALLFVANGVYSLLFELWGAESIVSEGDRLRVERTVFGIGHRASYAWTDVAHLRLVDGPYWLGWGIGRSLNGRIGFDYGDRVVRFGDDLEVDEAVKLVRVLEARAPHHMPSSGAV